MDYYGKAGDLGSVGDAELHEQHRVTKEIYTVQEVAVLLGISKKAVYARVARQQLPGVRKVGRSVFFNVKILKRWLETTLPVLSPERF